MNFHDQSIGIQPDNINGKMKCNKASHIEHINFRELRCHSNRKSFTTFHIAIFQASRFGSLAGRSFLCQRIRIEIQKIQHRQYKM